MLSPDGTVISGSLADFTSIGALAALAWCTMLVLAVKETIGSRLWQDRLLRTALLFLLYQLALHMFYGDEPFLYSAHFLPSFMIIVATGLAESNGENFPRDRNPGRGIFDFPFVVFWRSLAPGAVPI